MKRKKVTRWIMTAVVLTAFMCFMSGCGGKKTQEETHVEGSAGLEYTLSEDGTYYIFASRGTCTDKDVVIGNWHEGKPVKEIASQASNIEMQQGAWEVNSITVSEGVTVYSFGSLWGTEATKIVLPDNVTELPQAMMLGNPNLREVVIGKGLKSTGPDVFENMILDTIYFRGSEKEWNEIEVNPVGNDPFTDAEIVFDYKD